ncbi:MAG TPA: 23S rRNA (uracil(1939)-C(5))-methyltransferase RlmD [Candidatus Acutalibacter stercoravium]|nr:23S rRNA (uracil(1939)-C(5))-methyltransferase RlmD [Candidatus Acutalibacter stercoravium]
MALVQKNEIVEMKITGMTAQGAGVGHYQGMAVFTPLTAPGDVARVRVVKAAKNYAYGRLEELVSPSADRMEPDCPCFAQCGGCCYRHITYEAELGIKAARVKDALTRIGGFRSLPVRPILGADSRDGYRNKALLPLGTKKDGSLSMGFYAVNSHRIVDCEECRLQPEEFNRAMGAFREWAAAYGDPVYDEATHSGRMRRLYLRKGEMTGQILACVVVNGNGLHHESELIEALKQAVPGLASVVVNSNRERTNVALGQKCRTIYGMDTIEDTLCGLRFKLSPLSFYQVNRTQAERLYEVAARYAGLTGQELLLDLYCGAGTIGLSMAGMARRLLGVEIVPQAVENARENARLNGIENAEFFCGDAGEAARMLAERGERPDVIVLDPPRKGCSPDLVRTVAEFGPKRIVYVSCDPATLARDLKLFAELGYPPVEAAPVDMFPGTAHVETVVLLSKGEIDSKKVRVEFSLEDMDMSGFQKGATYEQIKAYVLEKYGLKVSSLYISQIKRKCGLDIGQNYNLSKKEDAKVPQCPLEKEAAIMDALKHFQMI